jgi:hypothetical protein
VSSPPRESSITGATLIVGLLLFGGGPLGLEGGNPEPVPVEVDPAPHEPSPAPDGASPDGSMPGLLGLAGLAAALAALQKQRGDLSPAAGLSLEADPVVVFVPGHGQPQGSEAFADLIEYMGIGDESVRHFDYRLIDGGSSAPKASAGIGIDDAVTGLNAYLAGVAGDGRDIYLVGFSKGGATIAELVADWDAGRWGPADSVVGAALLDPPIASGPLGWMQSLGRHWGPVPDDGGYNPVQCTFLRFGCADRRVGLGRESSVEVVVIRNPKAAVTSFGDDPVGLRVYDAADDGPTIGGQLLRNPFALPARISQAHDAVLHDRKVADCLVAELRSGRCDLPKTNPVPPLPGLTRGAVRAPAVHKLL